MPHALTRYDLEQMLAQGLSQREISKRTGIPRSTLQRLMKAPYIPEVLSEGVPQVDKSRPLPQSLVEAGPVLLEMAAWWMQRQAAAASPVGGRVETKRYTFHAEVSLIDLVQREADAERVSYSEVINRALRQYFGGQVRRTKKVDGSKGIRLTRCSGLQTVAPKPANKHSFRLTFGANKRTPGLTLTANEPTFPANSLQTAR